jgi:hypothetical protein
MDTNCGDLEKIDKRRAKAKASGINGNGFGMTVGEMANRGMLPTPIAGDWKGHKRKDGTASMLSGKASLGLLPTPLKEDWKGGTAKERTDGGSRASELKHFVSQQTGKSSQLNPRFVAEMMGFPSNWTELPFQSGDENPSKDMETQ